MNEITVSGDLSSSGSLGNARWADPDDIFNRYAYKDGDIWLGRNPHNGNQAIGHSDDRHIIVCAGSRSGKGRSFVINNLALWQGSTVTYDPKGELPTILAARRGQGDDYCEGMDQDVFVLDPLNHSGVDPKYLAYFDPLAGLDPNDGEFITFANRIAQALIKIPQGTESEQWAKRASRYIATLIMHVMTYKGFADEDRNLRTVLKLILQGRADIIPAMKRQAKVKNAQAEKEGRKERLPESFDPLEELARDMRDNKACRGYISESAENMLLQVKSNSSFFESIRSEAADQLTWLYSQGIETSLTGNLGDDANGKQKRMPKARRLDPERLKTDPKGISVFVVMPIEDLQTYEPWLQVVFLGLFAAMRNAKGKPKSKQPVLAVLDEFSSLGYQDYIINSLDNIAGSGMKLMIVVQNFGNLKERYKDRMESFFTNAGLEVYFGKIGQVATDYLQKELGHTEIVKVARSVNKGENFSSTSGTSTSRGKTVSEGGSESISLGESVGKSWNWSKSVNYSDSRNWGQSSGNSMGTNYGPHIFFQPNSWNRGSSSNRNSGGGHTKSRSHTKGGGKTVTNSKNKTEGSSWNTATSETYGTSKSTTEGYSIGGGMAETFHRKPLLEPNEIAEYLRPLDDDERDNIAYPGFMLVRMQGEKPTFLLRSNYDQDIIFERCFTPDTNFDYLPVDEQRLLGYQYTEDHIWDVKLPNELIGDDRLIISVLQRVSQWFENHDPVLKVKHINGETIHHTLPEAGRITSIASHEEKDSEGSILTAKIVKPINDNEAIQYIRKIFASDIAFIDDEREQQRQKDERRKAEENARAIELSEIQQEKTRKTREKIKTTAKVVGAIAAVLIAGLAIISQIEQSRIKAANQLIIDTRNQENAFQKSIATLANSITSARQLRLNQIEKDKQNRQSKIDAANRKRQNKINAAKSERKQKQDKIDRDKRNLANARADREARIQRARLNRQKSIDNANSKRVTEYKNDFVKWQAKVDDEWNLIEQQKNRALKQDLRSQRIHLQRLKSQKAQLRSIERSRDFQDAISSVALKVARAGNVSIGAIFTQKLIENTLDFDKHKAWQKNDCNSTRGEEWVICNVILEITKIRLINSPEYVRSRKQSKARRIGRNVRRSNIKPVQLRFIDLYSNDYHNILRLGTNLRLAENAENGLAKNNRNIARIEADFDAERRKIEAKYRKPKLSDYPEVDMSKFPVIDENDFPIVDESLYPLAKKRDIPLVDMSQFPQVDLADYPEIIPSDYPEIDMNKFEPIDMGRFPLVKLSDELKHSYSEAGMIKY